VDERFLVVIFFSRSQFRDFSSKLTTRIQNDYEKMAAGRGSGPRQRDEAAGRRSGTTQRDEDPVTWPGRLSFTPSLFVIWTLTGSARGAPQPLSAIRPAVSSVYMSGQLRCFLLQKAFS
jgi:hypothetical protein